MNKMHMQIYTLLIIVLFQSPKVKQSRLRLAGISSIIIEKHSTSHDQKIDSKCIKIANSFLHILTGLRVEKYGMCK